MAKSFRDLIAWQKAMTLVTEIYQATEDKVEELLKLCSELGKILNGLIDSQLE